MMIRWWEHSQQSGTKPNLVAKILATNSGLDTNGCPLRNSKFILLSDNLNICLWLSACQVDKINQKVLLGWTFINDWVNRKLRSESIFIFDPQCTRSCKFYSFNSYSKENKAWLTGYTRPFHGWLVAHGQPGRCSPGRLYDVMPALIMWWEGGQQRRWEGHTLWMLCQRKTITMKWLISCWVMVLWTNRKVEL